MRNLLLVTQREYLSRVTQRSFIWVTLLVPLGFVALMLLQVFITAYSGTTLRVALANYDPQLFTQRAPTDSEKIFFVRTTMPIDSLVKWYKDLDFDGVLYVPPINVDNPNGFKYISDKVLGLANRAYIENQIADQVKQARLRRMGIDSDVLNEQIGKLQVKLIEENPTGAPSKGTILALGIGMGMGFLMYLVIFIYGALVMRGVMEEKTNRIVEVMLSSVKPFELMVGKIWGIGLVGLTQFAIWLVFLLLINLSLGLLLGAAMPTGGISLNESSGLNGSEAAQVLQMVDELKANISQLPIGLIIACFVYYFVMGYTFYAALFAALSSAINNDNDAQSLTFPVSIPIILGVFILTAAAEQPDSNLVLWSSMIPFFAPIIMPFRVAFGVPTGQLLLSMVLMLLGTWLAVWLAAKIYRTGILLYGKKVSLSEIVRWAVKA